ncbi:hypothetical protein [Pseudomonas sp. JUb52]|uniref:hypothetical protein n=1 Tax=Pseudomonas sp. JUb52 TaxID=2485127 RepID=UPI0010514303|nr:hypothetical protein [Pseudomonas sp. JUb52]TCQ83900.1 hypothetical protein EC839_11410 [Pseudomonas sp. JUb52]
MTINWNDEATYIERVVSEETGVQFNHCDATQLRYCRMQLGRATKAGATKAAERIRKAIEGEWPGKSKGY